jgi:hypothetical protein
VKTFEMKLSVLHKYTSEKNLSHSPPGKTVFCFSTSPADLQILKQTFVGNIQQFKNKFSSWFEDFHKRADEIRMFPNPFGNGTEQVPVQMVKVKFTLEQAMKAQRGSTSKALPFLSPRH